jgi:hypothetical protein
MRTDGSVGIVHDTEQSFIRLPHCSRGLPEAALVELDRNGLEVLGREECIRLLGTTTLGRVGITVGALPVVLPVNFCLLGGDIVVRTGAGTKLAAATRNAVVAFEVDEFDPFTHLGWSVVVTGTARHVTGGEESRVLREAGIPRWAVDGEDHLIAIDTSLVSGRRITPGVRTRERRS